MRAQGLDVDEGIYGQLLDTLARAGQTALALESMTQLVRVHNLVCGFEAREGG
jgi:hypothetical protein